MEDRRQELAGRMAELFALPRDLVAGLPHMEMLGSREFFLEGHGGLLSYGDTAVDICAGNLTVRVRGEELTLRAMTESEIRITGKIDAVEFL